MRDIYIKLDTGEIRKVNKKRLLALILALLGVIAIITVSIVSIVKIAGKPSKRPTGPDYAVEDSENAEDVEPIMGDIFSRGYYAKKNTEVLTANMSDAALGRIKELKSPQDVALAEVYEKMKKDNPDFAGYLTIEGTDIEYPVMHTPDEPEKYLHKDINGRDSSAGLPFIDAACSISPDSDNLIIYGHNMKDGSMFGNLEMYGNPDYCAKHPIIRFDTPDEIREYEVMAAFYDRVYYTDENAFRFYDFIDAKDSADYERAVNTFIDKSAYDTGVRAEPGDRLITLVTCSYHEDNGRFVLVARQTK